MGGSTSFRPFLFSVGSLQFTVWGERRCRSEDRPLHLLLRRRINAEDHRGAEFTEEDKNIKK
jgi:hypothetical protein